MVKLHMKFNKRIQNCTKTLSMSYGCLFKDFFFLLQSKQQKSLVFEWRLDLFVLWVKPMHVHVQYVDLCTQVLYTVH